MLSSIRLDGTTAAMVIDGPTDAAVFRTYVENVLVPTLRPGDIVALDNLSPHKQPEAVEAVARAAPSIFAMSVQNSSSSTYPCAAKPLSLAPLRWSEGLPYADPEEPCAVPGRGRRPLAPSSTAQLLLCAETPPPQKKCPTRAHGAIVAGHGRTVRPSKPIDGIFAIGSYRRFYYEQRDRL